jgi:aspartate aminotransferase-like enzyme
MTSARLGDAGNNDMEKLRLFTPGPVPLAAHIRAIGAQQPPYNRTADFSEFTHELLDGLKYVFQTEGDVALLTASGTAGMEASVLNFLNGSDKALIINGGAFGQRWCDLCDMHCVPYDEVEVPLGADVELARLSDLLREGQYTALLVNAHETTTGHLYDIAALGRLARQHGMLFMVDAISSICADQFLMDEWHVDVAILSSHKALALPPGLAFVAMSDRASARLDRGPPKSLYFNLTEYLVNQRRGQLPYTPAIGIMLQLHQRLEDIRRETLANLVLTHKQRALSFRSQIEDLPFAVLPFRSSNAITALRCEGLDAVEVVQELRDLHQIVVASSGGDLKSKVIRIAHMGAQDDRDLQRLIFALRGISAANTCTSSERLDE